MSQSRQLVAIMFTDIVGYTAIMQKNEREALRLLNQYKELIEKLTPAHEGKIVQFFGDGGVLTFDSSTECVRCALALQKECKDTIKIPVRIGIHLGEVIFQSNNIFGDGVNIASRVESMGVPGGILMSKSIRDQIKNKAEFSLSSLGSFVFKNVEESMEIFALANEGLTVPKRADLSGKLKDPVDSEKTLRLAAIMFTDIVDYTALMSEDETKAKRLLIKNREIQKPLIEKYDGTWLKEMGDDVLACFKSASDAVSCAKEIIIATVNESGFSLRIGIHIGDVVFKGSDVWGDGVNIASRIQELAPNDGILVSEGVNMNVVNQKEIKTEFLREVALKNVKQPVKVYQVEVEGVDALIIDPETSFLDSTEVTQARPSTRKALNQMKLAMIAIGALVIFGIGYMFYNNSLNTGNIATIRSQVLDKSIAVIPFENLSADEENQYFADGQTEAILNHLTKIADLRVISRTTMMGYSGTTKSTPTIAKELGVQYVLVGSVQKFGQKVRINAQLIDSNTDKHLWSDNFDRDLIDIFSIQTEIAKNVAQELQATITSREQAVLESVPTTNLTAYDFYLKGEDYLWRSYQEEDFRFAIQMFERAVEIDLNFVLAWVGLASASRAIYWFRQDRSKEHLAQTKQYLDKAIALDPDLMEVQLETGRYYYHCQLNYSRALEIFEKLISDYPKNDQLYFWTGLVYRRRGQFEKAFEYMERAVSLNPSSWENRISAGETLIILRRYAQAEDDFKTTIDLNPSWGGGYINLAGLYLTTGELAKARALLVNNQNIDHPAMHMQRSNVELMDRNYQKAISILESSPQKIVAGQMLYMPKSLQLGLIYYVMSERELANAYFQEARQFLEVKLGELPDDSRLYSSLGIVYAGLGMREEAMAAGNNALAIINISIDAMRGYYRELDMAKILLMIGEYDEAIAKLEFLLQQNGELSVELLKIDPFWDPLRDIHAFKALIKMPKYQINLEDE